MAPLFYFAFFAASSNSAWRLASISSRLKLGRHSTISPLNPEKLLCHNHHPACLSDLTAYILVYLPQGLFSFFLSWYNQVLPRGRYGRFRIAGLYPA